jgi:hypothetical protein
MPRRVIYIRNPREGSNFRTLDGGGSSPRTPRAPKPPKPPKPPAGGGTTSTPGTIELTGGAIYNTAASQWYISNAAPAPHYFGQLPGYGIQLDNTTPEFDDFTPAETLWGSLYLIAHGIDPYNGDVLAPFGTPGTLRPLGPLASQFANEMIGRNASASNPLYHGGITDLPSGYTVKHPNRNQKRPWWAK